MKKMDKLVALAREHIQIIITGSILVMGAIVVMLCLLSGEGNLRKANRSEAFFVFQADELASRGYLREGEIFENMAGENASIILPGIKGDIGDVRILFSKPLEQDTVIVLLAFGPPEKDENILRIVQEGNVGQQSIVFPIHQEIRSIALHVGKEGEAFGLSAIELYDGFSADFYRVQARRQGFFALLALCITLVCVVLSVCAQRLFAPGVLDKNVGETNRRITPIRFFFVLGLFIVTLYNLPYLFLGENSFVVIHDQLDYDIVAYKLTAENLFSNEVAEFMGGASKSSLVLSSPGTLVFYLLLPAGTAFLVNQSFVHFVAFIGMYFLLTSILNKPGIAFSVAVIFSALPFHSVYGLSVMGQPLLCYGISCITKKERRLWLRGYILVAIFALFSSLVYVGYFILPMILIIYICYKKKDFNKRILAVFAIMSIIYFAENYTLIHDLLFENTLSHREQHMVVSVDFGKNFAETLWNGGYHAESQHRTILIMSVALCLFIMIKPKYFQGSKKTVRSFVILVCVAVFIALFRAFGREEHIVAVINRSSSALSSLQFERVFWLYPMLWFLILGYVCYFLSQIPRGKSKKIISTLLVVFAIVCVGADVYQSSAIKTNIKRALKMEERNSSIDSINQFVASPLFSEIAAYIDRPMSSYRVVSIGMHPSVSLLNGFYTLDGYTNNYSVEYMKSFRKIIERELAKNEELRKYFDEWGNRCYVFVDQIPKQFIIDKRNASVLTELELNVDQIKTMGGEYILSTLPIQSPYMDSINLERVFERSDYLYRVYLYKITSE